jgi:hypothetical protein
MEYTYFTRTAKNDIITFKNYCPIPRILSINYFIDDSSGTFSKKEFSWSIDNKIWSSFITLTNKNLCDVILTNTPKLYLEIKYTLSSFASGNVDTFKISYKQYGYTLGYTCLT